MNASPAHRSARRPSGHSSPIAVPVPSYRAYQRCPSSAHDTRPTVCEVGPRVVDAAARERRYEDVADEQAGIAGVASTTAARAPVRRQRHALERCGAARRSSVPTAVYEIEHREWPWYQPLPLGSSDTRATTVEPPSQSTPRRSAPPDRPRPPRPSRRPRGTGGATRRRAGGSAARRHRRRSRSGPTSRARTSRIRGKDEEGAAVAGPARARADPGGSPELPARAARRQDIRQVMAGCDPVGEERDRRSVRRPCRAPTPAVRCVGGASSASIVDRHRSAGKRRPQLDVAWSAQTSVRPSGLSA